MKKPLYKVLYVQVLAAIVIGVLLGFFFPDIGASMKPLGDGFMDAPISGKKKPKRTPITMAARTCTYSTLYNGFFIQSLLINGINPR